MRITGPSTNSTQSASLPQDAAKTTRAALGCLQNMTHSTKSMGEHNFSLSYPKTAADDLML